MNPPNFESHRFPNATKEPTPFRTILAEPLRVIVTATFWLFALPLVGISLGCVKIWDAFVALNSSGNAAANPLILRRNRQPDDTPAFASPTEIWASIHI